MVSARRRAFVVSTRRDKDKQPAPDLVKREFKAGAPNQLWVADMTYVPTWAGFIYLAIVLDVWSRRIVGWAIARADDQRSGNTSTTTARRHCAVNTGYPPVGVCVAGATPPVDNPVPELIVPT